MKKNQGFTLVELLAVLALLSVIAVMIYPLVDDYIDDSKEKGYNVQLENMIAAAKEWVFDHPTQIPKEGATKEIFLSTLIDEGYIEEVENPKTNTNFEGTTKVKLYNNNGAFEYTVVEP